MRVNTDGPIIDTGYSDGVELVVYDSAMAKPFATYVGFTISKLIKKYEIETGSCLDLACGAGRLVSQMQNRGWQSYGCDLSSHMIELSRSQHPDIVDHFFEANMSELPTDRQYDLVTLVFNSIHYLDETARMKFWDRLCDVLKPGAYFLCQHNTFAAISRYWINKTHRWVSSEGYAYWTGLPGPRHDSVLVDKLYFQTRGEECQMAHVRHLYHFFEDAAMRSALEARGIKILSTMDGRTLGRATDDSEGVWVVCQKQ